MSLSLTNVPEHIHTIGPTIEKPDYLDGAGLSQWALRNLRPFFREIVSF